jgi:hypothetical protein
VVGLVLLATILAGCASPWSGPEESPARPRAARSQEPSPEASPDAVEPRPERFTIAPDDYHVPYAGTAEDGRKFFLSQELFSVLDGVGYVGLFLWKPNGTFDELRVDEVDRPDGVPVGQAGPAGADDLVAARLAELGDYVLEPIEVEPFTRTIDGVTFGWKVGRYDDGSYYVNIHPGDFIAYYAPWDGRDYDT